MPRILLFVLIGVGAAATIWGLFWSRKSIPATGRSATIGDRVREFGPRVDARLLREFSAAGIPYPPAAVSLIALKHERVLELWAGESVSSQRHIKSYPILAASGVTGPKLREGDRQVPEGIYRVEWLNPNSRFHLSMRLSYPNSHDRARAAEDGRDPSQLGGAIMIHGGAASVGCLAVGDPASEELFIIAAHAGIDAIQVIIAPGDLRTGWKPDVPESAPPWTPELHSDIHRELARYR